MRAVGAGHSFTPAVLTDDVMVSLQRMTRVLDVDSTSGHVRIEAGISLHELNLRLAEHGRALENLGDIDVQSIAGATQTGTHGTGATLRNISASIVSLQLVTGTGDVVELSEDSDPDGWRAARVGLGALGIVTEMTLRTVPAFVLHGVDSPGRMIDVLERIDELAGANEHFEFYLFPHSDRAQTRINNRTERPPKERSHLGAYMNDIFLVNHVFGLTQRVAKRFPRSVPRVNRFVAAAWGKSERIESSYKIFSSPRLVRFVEMEYAIPRHHVRDAVTKVHEVASRADLAVSFPIEVRFVAADDAFLSPASGRDTAYVAVHVYRGMEFDRYFREVEAVMDAYEGRPHWGKRHYQTAEVLRGRYPDFDRFLTVRDRFDPERRFANRYIEQVLGP